MSTSLTNKLISLAAMIAVLAVLATACVPTPPPPPPLAPAAVPIDYALENLNEFLLFAAFEKLL